MSQWINDCGHDTKALYKLMSGLTFSQSSSPLPDPTTESTVEKFPDYFIDKIDKIWSDLDKYDKYDPSHKTLKQTLSNFEPMTNEHVLRIINSTATKSCESDPISTSIFKKAAQLIIDEITATINISLCKSVFASQWKNAIIHPLLKKFGLHLILRKYRPVSNLSFLLNSWTTYCDHHDHMTDYQSAYRTDYSCEIALVKLTSGILNAMEYQKAMALVVLYLSVAFNAVGYGILLTSSITDLVKMVVP